MSPQNKTCFHCVCRHCQKLFETTDDSWQCPRCKLRNDSTSSLAMYEKIEHVKEYK